MWTLIKSTQEPAMIRVIDVTHHYGIRPVLKNVSLEIATGELVTVVGPMRIPANGAQPTL
jgi:ABC-type transporter Mla maintaining outer membrane lipid asymmetry ATPase subunit MlaF